MSSSYPPPFHPATPPDAADSSDDTIEILPFASVTGQPVPVGRRPILLAVDDSSTVRAVIEFSFARIGVPVVSFGDGLAAIRALLEGRIPVPDLVLLDIGLPRMDGYEVAGILRTNAAFANTPILMLSGRDGLFDRVRSKMVGARGFISKPFRVRELVAIVSDHLGLPVPEGVAPSREPGSGG
jgi:twitching motility two-component system response regulator PilG